MFNLEIANGAKVGIKQSHTHKHLSNDLLVPSPSTCYVLGDDISMAGFELSHQLLFESACGFPKNTNFTPAFKECLDYIFYEKDNLVVESVVPLPEEEQLSAEGGGIPSQYFPSDHLPLICDLRWK